MYLHPFPTHAFWPFSVPSGCALCEVRIPHPIPTPLSLSRMSRVGLVAGVASSAVVPILTNATGAVAVVAQDVTLDDWPDLLLPTTAGVVLLARVGAGQYTWSLLAAAPVGSTAPMALIMGNVDMNPFLVSVRCWCALMGTLDLLGALHSLLHRVCCASTGV